MVLRVRVLTRIVSINRCELVSEQYFYVRHAGIAWCMVGPTNIRPQSCPPGYHGLSIVNQDLDRIDERQILICTYIPCSFVSLFEVASSPHLAYDGLPLPLLCELSSITMKSLSPKIHLILKHLSWSNLRITNCTIVLLNMRLSIVSSV